MSIVARIKEATAKAIESLYQHQLSAQDITVNQTKPEFEGDYTVVLFAFVKTLRTSPDALGQALGQYLVANNGELFTGFNLIKGFLNLTVTDNFFLQYLQQRYAGQPDLTYGAPQKVMVEYSSPNTNKPLHLGHLRNNFLGWSVAEILKASGNEVMKTCIVNDRGIHICKSMIAWQDFANGATPESTGTKGDHFVGDYYVKFSDTHKAQMKELEAQGLSKEEAEKQAPIMLQTQQMLVDWEAGKPEVMELWKKMNSWVYAGFDQTYKRIGTDFDKTYYESQTYLLGRKFVEEGLEQGVFYKKEDGSVWIDLTAEGLDEKLVLRKDGTSVYITQDLGLADEKYGEFPYDQSIYVIADEQNYHMKVLQLILKKLGKPYADGIFHLSYGMVELPTGRMKSREGTVVDADDLVEEMVAIAARHTEESGKVKDFTEAELKELYDTIAIGALKFFLLRVDPKKKMIFNPEESIDFHGFTGPFIQYTHARIKSILRRQPINEAVAVNFNGLEKLEKELLVLLEQYPGTVRQAAVEQNPSVLAIYAFNVAKTYNSFYTEHSVLSAESEEKKELRLRLCQLTATTIKSAMGLLGIRVPERM
ncbi:arginyl-tRNA synthetase [Cnuella takakiae]|uniref:Arginine--tRNA ligase n=1 Tax=Cnuella takakiae TaxID=1302690 RepID=A0A1M4V5S0_9BACT|nr:arginine--tRNA ligase [Cnuella takakiae]OLY92701.1 arginine--tRNA ligase [Cnuella takakiae]SHE64218.1 arginyl-tRNA synthetase [Cnuella takakiae]